MAILRKVNISSLPYFVYRVNQQCRNDAQAICEAASRPSMHFVCAKTLEQQDIQSIHRVRSRLIAERTALVNQARGLLAEYGIIVGRGIKQIRQAIPLIIEDASNELTIAGRSLCQELYEELCEIDKRIAQQESKLTQIFKSQEACQRIGEIEGIGLLTATAIIASVGQPELFKNGRQLSAWLGLVPKQHSSGNKRVMLGISKRGDGYIRQLLIHGARVTVQHAKHKTDKRSLWLQGLVQRCGMNKAVVALANKNARIIGSLLKRGSDYQKCYPLPPLAAA